ncbi:hypothetical protein WMF31_35780 [Sorangium sp. So ce1036]|uniref:hypothetical protein n=1 Tax=Sorangium sp. So ce1036 TaxID=3133328 RepID=UPI003F084435
MDRRLVARRSTTPRGEAAGRPFDNGLFELALEDLDGPDPGLDAPERLVQLTRKPRPRA